MLVDEFGRQLGNTKALLSFHPNKILYSTPQGFLLAKWNSADNWRKGRRTQKMSAMSVSCVIFTINGTNAYFQEISVLTLLLPPVKPLVYTIYRPRTVNLGWKMDQGSRDEELAINA
jgi:hypothetical protein